MLENAAAPVNNYIKAWNTALEAELLDGRYAARPLYLFVEPERLEQMAEIIGTPLAFAASESLKWRTGVRLFAGHLAAACAWERTGKVGPPPFLSLLVAMTSAAAAMVSDQKYLSHNYRDRLSSLLGASGPQSEKLKRELPDTVPLWLAFNDWLDDWDGELGLPTAHVQGRQRYVGYPISQALIRERDRIAMHSAFDRYGLAPGRRISVAEMSQYIADWIGHGRAPNGLIRLWADDSVHERIAQIACLELEHWATISCSRTHDESPLPSRLEWLAELALEPIPEIALYLINRGDPSIVAGHWSLGPRTDQAGREAVAQCLQALDMRLLPGLGATSLEPWDHIGATSLLAGVLELVREDVPHVHLLRSPAPVLALTYDDRDGRYHEASRTQLLERCLVLAHEQMTSAVERHLATYARAGFRTLAAGSVKGLPAAWTAFVDVVMVQAADEVKHSKLAVLCAAPATLVNLVGGLRIGQGTWHSARPPEVLSTLDANVPFTLMLEDRRSDTKKVLGHFVGRGAAKLEGLEAGDYEVQVVRQKRDGSTVVRCANFRLRSANHPRPSGVRRDWGLGFDLADAISLVSTKRMINGEPTSWMRGALLGQNSWAGPIVGPAPNLSPPMRRAPSPETPSGRRSRVDNSHFAQSCAVLGYHRWLCEPAGPDDNYRTLKWKECQQCHRFEWTRDRGTAHRPVNPARQRSLPNPTQLPRYARSQASETEAQDLLLDALSYIAGGNTDVLRVLSAELSDDEMFLWRTARQLAALGHLDLEFSRETMRLVTWQVTPPALAEAIDRSWVLVGARSSSMVAELTARLAQEGLELTHEATHRGPAVYRVQALEEQLERARLFDVPTPLGAGIALSPRLAERILGAAPPISAVLGSLPHLQVGGTKLERFDVTSATWIAASHDRPGAYRVESWGRAYGFTLAEDLPTHVMRLTDSSLAKYLAARMASASLLGYEPSRHALTTPVGAELPLLLERAAVACSGTLPRYRADLGQLEHASIPPAIAQTLQLLVHS